MSAELVSKLIHQHHPAAKEPPPAEAKQGAGAKDVSKEASRQPVAISNCESFSQWG